jgi:hypothetical protein
MGKYKLLSLLLLQAGILSSFALPGLTGPRYSGFHAMLPDTLRDKQVLYNGRVWKNLYYNVEGDMFLFSRDFLPGTVSMAGKTFTRIPLKYDILKDELLTPASPGGILQLNKEMVDSFLLLFQNRSWPFIRVPDMTGGLNGYVHVVYKGSTALYVKYIKKIDRPAVENRNDRFYQLSRIFLVKDTLVFPVTGKGDFYRALRDRRAQVRDFVKSNRTSISKNDPESFVPVLRFYDNLQP